MKIIRTIESFYPYISGPANQAFEISKRLGQKGIQSPIFTTNYKARDAPREETMENVTVKRFPIGLRFMKYFYSPNFKRALQKTKFDMIHAHNYRNYQTDTAFKLAKKRNKPFVLHAHGSLLGYRTITKGMSKAPYGLYDSVTRKRTALDADAVVVSSEQEAKEAREFGISDEKLHKIPMGIDLKKYFRAKEEPNDVLDLLFVGRICRDRNIMPILKALKILDDKNIRLRIVGGAVKRSSTEKAGYLEELKDYAKDNHLDVEFKGQLKGKDLIHEYKKADAFVYTSLWENFGQPILEAAATGLPVIATPVGVALELLEIDKTGYLVDFDDEHLIADKIERLKDKRKRALMGRNIAKLVKQRFDWEDIMMQYERLYLMMQKKHQ